MMVQTLSHLLHVHVTFLNWKQNITLLIRTAQVFTLEILKWWLIDFNGVLGSNKNHGCYNTSTTLGKYYSVRFNMERREKNQTFQMLALQIWGRLDWLIAMFWLQIVMKITFLYWDDFKAIHGVWYRL